MSKDDLKNILRIVMMLVFLKLLPSSCESTDNSEVVNSAVYKAFLNNILMPSKQLQGIELTGDKMVKEQKSNKSPYERVIRNLRKNWEMPSNYLQQRGYLKNSNSPINDANSDLSMDAFDLMNPSTSKNVYPLSQGPNSLLFTKPEGSDRALDIKVENE